MELAQYDPECESTCRTKIDIMLIECRLAFLRILKAPDEVAKASAPTTFLPMPDAFSLPATQVNLGSSAAGGFSGSAPGKHSPPVLGGKLQAIGAEPSSTSGEATPVSTDRGFPALPPNLGGNSRAIDHVPGGSSSASGECTPGSAAEARPSTPPPARTFNPRELTIYPELDMSVEITDRRDPSSPVKWRVSGKADWALAYGDREDSLLGNVLMAVEAKNPSTFSNARDQLLTYLAIMHRLRQQNYRTNQHVQGFYSDGDKYGFLAITNDGEVLESGVFECRIPHQLKTIFN